MRESANQAATLRALHPARIPILGCLLILAISGIGTAAPQSGTSAAVALPLDHALICTSDLAVTEAAFTAVGLRPDYGGHHGHARTQMAQLGFPDGTYIGIEAPLVPGAATGTMQSELMLANAGPCGWSMTSIDLHRDLERVAKLGVIAGAPEPRSRKRPDGTLAAWQSASLGPGAPGSKLPFLMEDKTPRKFRAPRTSASIQGTGITGVGIVVLGVKNLDESAALFRKVFGWPAPRIEDHPEFGAKLAYFSGTPVVLAAASAPDSWVAKRIARLGECPVAFLLHTSDFHLTQGLFSLAPSARWFGLEVSWFSLDQLHGIRLGIVGK
ncbi:MAG: VOC family protein [Candidatus Acidiferrales bacterium]